jgi:hypothetical protein
MYEGGIGGGMYEYEKRKVGIYGGRIEGEM